METVKRTWKSPVKSVQEFVPQEYVAGCAIITGFIDYLPSSLFGYGYYNNPEENFTSGQSPTAEDGTYNNVSVYYRTTRGWLPIIGNFYYYDSDDKKGEYSVVVIKNGRAYNNHS